MKHLVSMCAAMLILGSAAIADSAIDRALERPLTSWLDVPSWVRDGITHAVIDDGRTTYGARFWLTRQALTKCIHRKSRDPRVHPSKTIGDGLVICLIAEQPFPLPPRLDLMTEAERNKLTEAERNELRRLRRENRRLRQEKDSQSAQDHGTPALTAKRGKQSDPGISKEGSPAKFACGRIKQLYEELQGFVGNSKFHDYQYAPVSPARDWYNRVYELFHTDGLGLKVWRTGGKDYDPHMLILIGWGLSRYETENRGYLAAVETTENFLSWCSKQSF